MYVYFVKKRFDPARRQGASNDEVSSQHFESSYFRPARFEPSVSLDLICTATRQIPASSSTNRGLKTAI